MDVIRDYNSKWNKPERDRQISCNITYVWDLKYEINEPIYKAEGTSQVALVVKNLPANAGDIRDMGSIPGSGRSPRGGHGNPLQYSFLENPMEEPGWLQSVGLQRIWHNWSDLTCSGKEPTCQCRRQKKLGFNLRVGKIPWRRAWQPTPVFFPGEFHGQRSLLGYSPWGCKESDMTERLTHTHTEHLLTD